MLSSAEKILQCFGVTNPGAIDLEAIAFELGALVVYSALDGCDARIVGHGKQAIITVDSKSNKERQRFSIGHELGHWKEGWHGNGFLCGREDIREANVDADARRDAEFQANRFSSDLLLPSYLFVPACLHKPLTIDTAQALAADFGASITASAIKLVKKGSFPGMVTCYSRTRREWFVSGEGLPEYFFPMKELHQDTDAFDLLYSDGWGKTTVVTNDGACWIDRNDAAKIRLREQSMKIAKDKVLSILWFQTLP